MGTFIGGAAVGSAVGGGLGLVVHGFPFNLSQTGAELIVEHSVRRAFLVTSPLIGSLSGGIAAEVIYRSRSGIRV